MEEETVTLPKPSDGFKYKLVSIVKKPKPSIRDKDPSELTSRQLATLRYREKNRQKLNEKKRKDYHEKQK